ncbi:MAG TPA: T9SS type A sorting domain-containing protein, partial [Flavisolibacter sp.]
GGSLYTAGYLTLKSTASGTARVAPITSVAAMPINGNVTVERYVSGRRRYRLITSPVTTNAGAALSAGQEGLSIWGNWQNGGNDVTANTGTIITGGSAADGFDQQTINASLYTYNDAARLFTGFTTANGKNTKYTPLKAGVAYYMFVYGDRTNTITTSSPKNTVISSTGSLVTGNQVYTTGSAIPLSNVVGRYTLLGNPFASPIDWAAISKANLANTFWGWDPNLNSTGGYVTVTTTGTVTLIAPFSGSVGLNQYIQSGQGFFVQTTGASPSLTIKEQDKVSNFNGSAFRTTNTTNSVNSIPLMAINLLYDNAGTPVLADGTLAAFDAGFSRGVGQEDASEFAGTKEGIAITNTTELLSIDARPMPVSADTLFLNVARLTRPQYTLQIFSQQLIGNNLYAYLEDRYLHTVQPLSLTDTNHIAFTVNADAASSDANRFRIVFSSFTTLSVNFTQVKGTLVNKDVRITWQVAQETGIKKYIVERSADGLHFKAVGEVVVNDNSAIKNYEWLDVQAVTGNNYYRIRALQANGSPILSKVVMVTVNAGKQGMTVFPNPVKDQRINIEMTGIEKGEYKVLLFNFIGQEVAKHVIQHDGSASRQIIQLTKKLVQGLYHLRIQNENHQYDQDIFVE